MLDAQLILSQARQGRVPSTWKIFSAKRSRIDGFFSRTLHDPDPLLIFTSEAVITYLDEKKPPTMIEFAALSEITLDARGSYLSAGSPPVIWLNLHFLDGKKLHWRGQWEWELKLQLEILQYFIEAYARYKVIHSFSEQIL